MEAVNSCPSILPKANPPLVSASAKEHGDSVGPTALLAVRGRRPPRVAELSTAGTQG